MEESAVRVRVDNGFSEFRSVFDPTMEPDIFVRRDLIEGYRVLERREGYVRLDIWANRIRLEGWLPQSHLD